MESEYDIIKELGGVVSSPDEKLDEDVISVINKYGGVYEEKPAVEKPLKEESYDDREVVEVDNRSIGEKAMDVFDSGIEMVTGSARQTEETESLPSLWHMPVNFGSRGNLWDILGGLYNELKTAYGLTTASPDEIIKIYKNQYDKYREEGTPESEISQDSKGNWMFYNPSQKKKYIIKPGMEFGDVIRGLAEIVPFIQTMGKSQVVKQPIKRKLKQKLLDKSKDYATQGTIEAINQAARELVQEETGGTFDKSMVGLGLVAPAVADVALGAGKKVLQAPTKLAKGLRETREALDKQFIEPKTIPDDLSQREVVLGKELKDVMRKKGSQEQLAQQMSPDEEFIEAIERTGVDAPAFIMSSDPAVQSVAGTAIESSVPAKDAMKRSVEKSREDIIGSFSAQGADIVDNLPSISNATQTAKARLDTASNEYLNKAKEGYRVVDDNINKTDEIYLRQTLPLLQSLKEEMGGTFPKSLDAIIEQIQDDATSVNIRTLLRRKKEIGQALGDKQVRDAKYGSMEKSDLNQIYEALSNDELYNYEQIALDTLTQEKADEVVLAAKQGIDNWRLHKDMESALDDSFRGNRVLGNEVSSLIKSAKSFNAESFDDIIRNVPDVDKKPLLITAFADASMKGDKFDFGKFVSLYDNLYGNRELYNKFIKNVGKEGKDFLRDIYTVSKTYDKGLKQVKELGSAKKKILGQYISPESYFERLFSSLIGRQAMYETVSKISQKGGGAIVGILSELLRGKSSRRLEAAGNLMASQEWKDLIMSSMKNPPTDKTINKVAKSKPFSEFWEKAKMKAIMSKELAENTKFGQELKDLNIKNLGNLATKQAYLRAILRFEEQEYK